MGKKVGKNALKIGGVAALGALAYKVYNDYQGKQSTSSPQETFNSNDTIHDELIIKAMIAAAKADGHVDNEEMERMNPLLLKQGPIPNFSN